MAHDALTLPPVPHHLGARLQGGGAVVWSEPVSIGTYEPAEADEYPMFLDRRVYQGSSGRVYPIPFVDRISEDKTPRSWQAVHLENRWIRLMVLPELGGRIHIGFDKSADYDFFYRNNVIKPALVGLAGPWISGGVEFNWPQHHRPGTFLPTEVAIDEDEDGTVTVWCSDHDPFTRMRGTHGIRLRPDRAVVELVVRLHNRTSDVQTFLWWANVAARVHDDYQSFFPTDVQFVADHARRAITAFPAADRPYYGVDYPARAASGSDRIDFYRNIPVPTSYMVTDTADDFFGGYDHAAQAGFVHVADRHIAPGKKQWTWGDDEFGHAWDRLLTDSDGPYVELMAGVYTDNQPDFAWLEPGETKEFTQSWYPIQKIGPAHQANTDAAVSLTLTDDAVAGGVCVTAERPDARITLTLGEEVVYETSAKLAPETPHRFTIPRSASAEARDYELTVRHDGRTLIRWRPRPELEKEEPWVATEPPAPEDVDTVDELYVTGVHLAQYRHPTRSPLPYWSEALRRDPLDSRTNTVVGEHWLRRGLYEDARRHLERALQRQTRRNGNPRDGEPRYLLGLVLTRLGDTEAAIAALLKAAWDTHWRAAATFEAARLFARTGREELALSAVESSIGANPRDSRALALHALLLRRLGREDESAEVVKRQLELDPLDQTALLLAGARGTDDPRTVVDVALELAAAGEDQAALDQLDRAISGAVRTSGNVRPTAHYHRAVILDRLGRQAEARAERVAASEADPTSCFPYGLDDHDALWAALEADPNDTCAQSLLGMLLYDAGRGHEALALWVRAVESGTTDPVTFRNAAIASVNLTGNTTDGLAWYARALELRPSARLVYERDQLLGVAGNPASERAVFLERFLPLVQQRDDATVVYCGLLVSTGRAGEAFSILEGRSFAPWEGGEGQTLAAWEAAALALSEQAEAEGDPGEAIRFVRLALRPPATLGEARHPLASTRAIHLRLSALYATIGEPQKAREAELIALAQPPVIPERASGQVDYFATSLPEFLLFRPAGQ